jgi:dTDP-4-dehydrorhamnose reductase
MADRLLITGCNGLLGVSLVDKAADNYDVIASSKSPPIALKLVGRLNMDITETDQVCRLVAELAPDVIIHCAAETRVDYCEENPAIAEAVNTLGTRNIALAAEQCGAHMVYISSDSVFDGEKGGYKETDLPNPVNVYAKTKLRGEIFVQDICSHHAIVRTNMYGWNMKNKDSLAEWVLRMLRGGNVVSGFTDVVFNPLLVNDLVEILLLMCKRKLVGVFHIGAPDHINKCDFAHKIAEIFDLDSSLIKPSSSRDMSLVARRPANTFLRVDHSEERLQRDMPTVELGLSRFCNLEQSGFAEYLKGPSRTTP